ncbi:hypothetical protein PM082_020356 [Marasmius tenuissimus]|nr:hypothetical protein PM082_020356 [Marasmius tenuissimus]
MVRFGAWEHIRSLIETAHNPTEVASPPPYRLKRVVFPPHLLIAAIQMPGHAQQCSVLKISLEKGGLQPGD